MYREVRIEEVDRSFKQAVDIVHRYQYRVPEHSDEWAQ